MAVTVSVGPLAFVLLFSPGIFWIPFWREKLVLGAIFVSKTETQLTFEHGAKRRRSKSPEQGGEDLNGDDPAKLGRRPFKPQTVLLRRSRAVGRDDIRRRRTELRKTSPLAYNNGYS